jgi:hypothetical protein
MNSLLVRRVPPRRLDAKRLQESGRTSAGAGFDYSWLRRLAQATALTVPSDDELIIGARTIVRGKVLSLTSRLDPAQDRIFL